MIVKYKLSEVAKDVGYSNKDLTDLLKEYGVQIKSNSQVLTEQELNIAFDALTQKNQVPSLSVVFEAAAKAAEERKKASEERLLLQQREEEERRAAQERAKEALLRPIEPKKPAQPAQPAQQKRPETKTLERKPGEAAAAQDAVTGQKVHYVDTRGSSVNIEKYDERLETLVPEKANQIGQQQKQKLVKQAQKRQQSQFGNKRRQEEQEKLRRLQQQAQLKKVPLKVLIPEEISVGELALRLKKTAADVIKRLMKLGVMASISQTIDFDTASIVAEEMGAVVQKEVILTMEDRLFDESVDREEQLVERAPVVVVMGHVDHGKTSLLDAIRSANVASGEAGGITQHIGAYRVNLNGRDITFLDTPGHAAFTSMRARGAQVTDVAILVVAADDGIMPQTIEAINHAKLTEYELVPEEWGGSTIICPVSAKRGDGIENLLEMVLLTADMLALRANPNRLAKGTVIEAKLDRGRGPVATILVQNGTLKMGDIVIAGTAVGRVRAMQDDRGRKLETAGPSVPVEITGLASVPAAGDLFHAVEDERMARDLAERRISEEKDERAQAQSKVTLENLFSRISEGNVKDLNIIVKADVQGTAEALKASIEKLSCDEVRVRVIHSGVGGVNDSDVMLASASNAIIVGFNVRPEAGAAESAARAEVDMRMYRVIYDCIGEIEQAMKGMLAPKFREVQLGRAEIRQVFKVTGVGTIAGCYVLDGKVQRAAQVRIVRDSIVIHEGVLSTLKRFKDDAKEVASGYECGMSFEKYNDIKEGDIVEAFIMEEVKQ